MLRTCDHSAPGRGRGARRILEILAVALVVCASGAIAQQASGEWGPYRGDEPLPADLSEADAVTAVWDHRIVGSTLKPRVNDVSYATNGSGGCAYVTAGSAFTVWNTPIIVPDGANVQYLRIYVNDTSASNIQGWFSIYDLFGGLVQEFGIASSGTPGETWFDTPAINHVIDYSLYSYVVNMRPNGTGSTLQFCGARVFYNN